MIAVQDALAKAPGQTVYKTSKTPAQPGWVHIGVKFPGALLPTQVPGGLAMVRGNTVTLSQFLSTSPWTELYLDYFAVS